MPTDLLFAAQNQAYQAARLLAHADLSNALVATRASQKIAMAAKLIAAARATDNHGTPQIDLYA